MTSIRSLGWRFTIIAQSGGEALIDYTRLKPRRLALAFARALRHLAAPGGPLGVRSTVKAYAVTLPQFLPICRKPARGSLAPDISESAYRRLRGVARSPQPDAHQSVHRPVKVSRFFRQIATDSPDDISPDLRDRLRYVSAKPFQRSRPRDAYSPFVAHQLRDAAAGRRPRRDPTLAGRTAGRS